MFLSENQSLGLSECNCSIPCHTNQFDAVISSSLLDVYKIKEEVTKQSKSQQLIYKYRETLEMSYQVSTAF